MAGGGAAGVRAMGVLRAVRWPLFGIAVITALVLGIAGFHLYYEATGDSRSFSDLFYLSLQLFTLESGSVPDSGAPWQLEVARLLSPATTGIAVTLALATVLREELRELRLRFRSGHVVVCGLDVSGARLVRALLDDGHRVVAITPDPVNPMLKALRAAGALVVVGDARSPEVLHRARVRHASFVVALEGSDDHNAEVAVRAGEMATNRSHALTCLAHVRDPGLCALLRSHELEAGHTTNYRLDFFNVPERGARAVLQDHSPFRSTRKTPAIAVIGLTDLGQAVIVEAARQWRVHPDAAGRRLRIAAFDPEAGKEISALMARYPQLEHVAEIEEATEDLLHPQSTSLLAREEWQAVYVCLDGDSEALEAALRVRRYLTGSNSPIVVELSRSAGLAELLGRSEGAAGLHSFDLFDRTLRTELLLGGTYEVLARAIHDEYVAEQRRQGATEATNDSLVPWDRLPDSLKESNRDQAAHVGMKLSAVGCGIAPLSQWDADQFEFTMSEIETLSEMEHERWVEQRERDGWTSGSKNVAKKTSPFLVAWEHLDEEVKEWDRRAVRGIPRFLAGAGYQIERSAPE